jgi:hypothetical protein
MIKWIEQDRITTMMNGDEAQMVIMQVKEKYDVYESGALTKIGTYDSLDDAKYSCRGYLKFTTNKNKSIAVIGVGTAGLTALSHLLAWTPDESTVVSVYDPETPILGIGESTTVHIPENLFMGTGFNLLQDAHELDATQKLGVRYTGFREKDFDSLILPPYTAMHFNNFKLKEFCFGRFEQKWSHKFRQQHGKVKSLINSNQFVTVVYEDDTVDGFDYVIDVAGYPTDYTDYNMSTVIPVNHCLVHMVPEKGDWNWTWHVAHRNGWMFGIPLQTRQGWGYLYNDEITPREDAVADIAERFNKKPEELELREFKFKRYYAKKFMDGRIVKNGNRALFFEPMEALSGYFYDQVMHYFISVIRDDMSVHKMNEDLTVYAKSIESFIAYVYKGGSNYDSEFWKTAQANAIEHLDNDQRFKNYMIELKAANASQRSNKQVYIPFFNTSWYHFDKNLGYNELGV